MKPPIISYVTFNRAGLTARNLNALLQSEDDFELHIIDNNSQDDTWAFLNTLTDPRIKEIKRFELNRGSAYAANYVMSQREKSQYYLHIDSDVHFLENDWLKKMMEVMAAYPEVGMLGAPAEDIHPPKVYEEIERGGVKIYKTTTIYGGNVCLRPELIDIIGYWNEENYRHDSDMSVRIKRYTQYWMAYVPNIRMSLQQAIGCKQCPMKDLCSLKGVTCYDKRKEKYIHGSAPQMLIEKNNLYYEELKEGIRTIYCASIHDEESMKNHFYHRDWAEENFQLFIDNAN